MSINLRATRCDYASNPPARLHAGVNLFVARSVHRGFFLGVALLSGNRAQRQTLHEIASYGEADNDHGQRHDRTYRRELAPVYPGLRDQRRCGYRECLAARAAKRRGEDIVVPGENQAQYRRGNNTWSG